MFNFTINRSSSNVLQINVNLVDKFVLVTYKSGKTYAFRGVSRRAMLNLLANHNLSMGKWVNENCKFAGKVRFTELTDVIDLPFINAIAG
jgi:hypothetical protein